MRREEGPGRVQGSPGGSAMAEGRDCSAEQKLEGVFALEKVEWRKTERARKEPQGDFFWFLAASL